LCRVLRTALRAMGPVIVYVLDRAYGGRCGSFCAGDPPCDKTPTLPSPEGGGGYFDLPSPAFGGG